MIVKKTGPPPGKKYNVLWDTGATNTVITKKIVNGLNLKPIGMTKTSTAGGVIDSAVYLVAIKLRNGVGITRVRVTEGTLTDEIDALIGMDIIALGDFSITNLDGKTTFSFRVPSIERVDFVEEFNGLRTLFPYLGIPKNSACPCGSRKKFKKCHGSVKQ